jgi:hypothetical protein
MIPVPAAAARSTSSAAVDDPFVVVNVFSWLAHPVLIGLKLPRGPRTLNPLLNNSEIFQAMPGNGLMNDAWLGQTVKPPGTG